MPAWLDPSSVTISPWLARRVVVQRRLQTVDSFGEPITTIENKYRATGIISPTGNNSVVRAEAYEAQTNAAQFITRFHLFGASNRPNGKSYLPDLVCYEAQTYLVKAIDDYGDFGKGYYSAELIMIDYLQTETFQVMWNNAVRFQV